MKIPTSYRRWIAAAAAICFLVNLCYAGFLEIDAHLGSPSVPVEHSWGTDPDGNGWLLVHEEVDGLDQCLVVSGLTDSDPVLTITKEVSNNTGETWFGYRIELTAGTGTFVGTPVSDTMALLLQTPTVLVFGLSPVENGEIVGFTFDVNVPDEGPFSFALDQSPRFSAATTEEIKIAVSDLADSAFHASGHRTAMLAILAEIEEWIIAGEIDEAVRKLENLRRRVDGCDGLAGELPDKNDWIVDCDAQRAVREAIDILLTELTA